MYVKNFIVKGEQSSDHAPTSRSSENGIQEFGKTDFKKSENQTSANPKNRLLEVRNSYSNNIDINNTDMSYIYDQSINPPRTDFQNFSPGAVGNDGLIDGIDRNTVEEEVKKQIDYDCLISHPRQLCCPNGRRNKRPYGRCSLRRAKRGIGGKTCIRRNCKGCL